MAEFDNRQHRRVLISIARRAMKERGFLPDFSPQAITELDGIRGPAVPTEESTRDLRNLLWSSIDNDDSLDLDQLTVAEAMPNGSVKVLVAIADVDAVVKKLSALDNHAQQNTTSVYTVAGTFPMLPEKLSTDLTSLTCESDRLAIVIELVLAGDGSLQSSDLYGAVVRNRAKLAYNSVTAWLEGNRPAPQGISRVKGLDENLRLQDRMAQRELTAEYAKDIEGVKDVKNEMTVAATPELVERTAGEKLDDASITAQVVTALLMHRSTSSLQTKVETRDGEVMLTGIAKNEAEKSLVSKLIADVHGVTSVKNHMTVEDAKTK